jgi:hypothetical protein
MRLAPGVLLAWLVGAPLEASAILGGAAEPPVAATIETTLKTADGHIRQFAFDGNAATFFASAENASAGDHFTLVFEKPVTIRSLAVTTGRPQGGDRMDAGTVEASKDGKSFTALAKFADGVARAEPAGAAIRALRIKATEDLPHPLAIREIAIESTPPLATFKYPVEFTVNVDDAPEMKEWAEKAARICERSYAMINEELKSDGFQPRHSISMTLKNDYHGVAATGRGRITGSVKYFRSHPDDFGAMVHETVHVVQAYRTGNNPGWLVEGIADYIRFYKYEPGKLRPISPDRAKYDGSYQVTARFLAYVAEKYDKEIVRKLNQRMREGEYRDEAWKELTKKTAQELEEDWRASLRKGTARGP